MHRHKDSVNMAGLSDNVNTNALQRNTPNPCGDSLAGYHIYSWSERHRNRVFPAFLSYQSQPRFLPPTPPPRRYPNERSRLLLEGLRNNGHFVLNGILIDLEDDRRAEEARAQEALEAEHATFHRKDEENKSAAARPALIEPKEQTGIENPANSGQQIRVARQTEPEDQAEVEKQIEPEHLAQPELSIEPKQQTEAGQQTQAEPSEAEQQTEPKQLSQPERPTESEQHTEAQQQIGAENQVETDQSRQRAPSFDPEFDGDRGIFSDPLAEFDGANPFTDFDGDHTHLHVEIDYGEDRGNLSESDNDDDSESERGSDRKTEEDPSSEDEFDGTDPFADFDGDHTHFHVPFDFEEDSSKAASEEISELNLELGRAPESEQDANLEPVQVSEDDPEQDHDIENQGVNMDSIDEILAAANSVDYTPEDEDEDEDMGDDVDLDYEDGEDIGDEDEHDMDAMPSAPFNPIAMGLKEIGGLAHFRVSSYKPGNGVDELKNDDTDRYWQSDGVQPHRLTMAFVKEVEIRALRFYVDYIQDESYTPTKIIWKAGTSENNLFKFAESELVSPSGWVDVPITGAGGGEDGNSLMAWVVRMEVVENHQNGKDTHIRGIKIYGFDDQLRAAGPTTSGLFKDGAEGELGFKMDETKNAEENEKALMAHLRSKDVERSIGVGDPSGTASSLDFIEDPILR